LVFVFGKYATLLQFSRWLTYDFILQAEKKGIWELLNESIIYQSTKITFS